MTRTRIATLAGLATTIVFLITACTGTSCTKDVRPQTQTGQQVATVPAEKAQPPKHEEDEAQANISADKVGHEIRLEMRAPAPTRGDRLASRSAPVAKMKALEAKRAGLQLRSMNAAGMGSVAYLSAPPPAPSAEFNTEQYDRIYDNGFLRVLDKPLSTFSIDVDAASYANMRRFITDGQLPPKDAIRIEELINYFTYDYPQPEGEDPFSITTEMGACPWNGQHRLVHVGLQGRRVDLEQLPPSNLVFLLDVSGSMESPDKLPLLKTAMKMLVKNLRATDNIAIVVYAGAAGLVLPSTPGDRKDRIVEAIEQLSAGGSTAGGAGIQLAYNVAAKNLIAGGNNRVILATDGDFNVGVSSDGDLVRIIEEKRKSGIFLTVLGFGTGNLKDSKMEKLADKGNGNYAYIDNVLEAKKVLVNEMGGTLLTIAKDVKIQVEFNPTVVQAYRLMGYVNRQLNDEDFNDDAKDAGELGLGHTVTALYEVVPVGVKSDVAGTVDELKYQAKPETRGGAGEILTVKFRYKAPDGDTSKLISRVLANRVERTPSENFRFSAAVAGFGMLLRDSEHKGSISWEQVREMARGARGDDPNGYRAEFVSLVKKAEILAEAQGVSKGQPYAVSD